MKNNLNLDESYSAAEVEGALLNAVLEKYAPGLAKSERARKNAMLMVNRPDFLKPSWMTLSAIMVMPLNQAVALACGINQNYASVIEYRVGKGDARLAIEKAHDLMKYLITQYSITSKTEVTLKRIAEWMQDAGLSVPLGFPGARLTEFDTASLRETRAEQEDRRLRELEDRYRGTADFSNGKWKFTGMKLLIEAEVARGAKRATDKPIREDLIAACERREKAKREYGDLRTSATKNGLVWNALTRNK